jgi:hypothetical protein
VDTNLIKYAAFYAELEKQAGLRSRIFSSLAKKFPELIKWGKKFKGAAEVANKSSHAFNPAFNKSKGAVESGMKAMFNTEGKLTHKPMFGVKHKAPVGFREITPDANHGLKWYQKDPVTWIKGVGRRQAEVLNYARENGIWKTVKRTIDNARHYTKEYNIGDKVYQARFKRSVAGQFGSVAGNTGVAFGGMEYMNKTDEAGRKLTQGTRVKNALKESALWTFAEPAMIAKMTAYDLPKLGIEGFKSIKNGF